MKEQELDRNEDATPYKLKQARDRGRVARSADAVSALVFTTAITVLAARGHDMALGLFQLDRALLIKVGQAEPAAKALWPVVEHALSATMQLLAPFFAALMLAAVLGNLMQTGPVWSFDPLKMDADRINPLNGARRLFSVRTLFDAARACIKLALLALTAYYALTSLLPTFHRIATLSPAGQLRSLIDDAAGLGIKLALVMALIAAVDLVYTRREFARQMRMSQRELKDELKHREGDPRIRMRMRHLRRDMFKRSQALRNTRHADVIITNPTHFAVALRYEHGRMDSPQLLAKGAGHLAAAMRAIAARHAIPVVQNPALARRLFRELDVECHVPQAMYADVARIIVWVFAMREQRAAAGVRA